MIVYANSDSYGVCSTGKTYVDFIGNALGADKIINAGLGGSCNQRIFRTSVRDLLELKKQNRDVLVLIGLGNPARSELWTVRPQGNDGHFKSFQPNSTELFTTTEQNYVKNWYMLADDEAMTTNLYFMLTMFTTFLESNGFRYLIWAGPMIYKPVDFAAPFIESFSNIVHNNSNILDLYNFSFSKYCSIIKKHVPYDESQFGMHGHHAELAHKDFADYIVKTYLNEI